MHIEIKVDGRFGLELYDCNRPMYLYVGNEHYFCSRGPQCSVLNIFELAYDGRAKWLCRLNDRHYSSLNGNLETVWIPEAEAERLKRNSFIDNLIEHKGYNASSPQCNSHLIRA